MKKIPMRKCVITNERFAKKELIRVVRTTENTVVVDLTGKLNGHGAYLKKDLDVFRKAKSSGLLQKALGCAVSDEVYEQLEKLI